MPQRVLITGGAGFIGSHLADELLAKGYQVRALDNLTPQVHGPSPRQPVYLNPHVELLVGDVRDPAMVKRALESVDAVFHFAAAVGVGQSMYETAHYTSVNNLGTAVLLEALVRKPVERLIVASSMSIYGEGAYRDSKGREVECAERTRQQFARGEWDPHGPDGEEIVPAPTSESKRPALASVYALSKFDQERLCLMIGEAYDIPTVALRFFNTYGPRQALSNPYTGVLAIFAARLLNSNRPLVFEDGNQRRDFVSVLDVARASRLALESPQAPGLSFNIGSGQSHTILDVARRIAVVLGREHIEPEIAGKYRIGDIRHCFADISRARGVLGYDPQVTLDDGLTDLAAWLDGQRAEDNVGRMREELAARGLTV